MKTGTHLRRTGRLFAKLRRSLYLKLFLSFLATCILFFIGLALFWNHYFKDLFYRDKEQLLVERSADLQQIVRNMQDGSLSSRELRISMRLISRSFNGQIWIMDEDGKVLYSNDPSLEGITIPKELHTRLEKALKNDSDFFIERIENLRTLPPEDRQRALGSFMIYYMPLTLNGKTAVAFLTTPVEDITEAIAAVRWNIWVPLMFSLAGVGMILFVMSRKLAGPLRDMHRASLALAERDFSVRVPEGKDDEVGQLAASFNLMIGELQRWEDSRQEFLANVSHELRSPLSALRGMIVAMKDDVIPAEKRPHYLQICDSEVQRLGRLVDELLDLARIQNGQDVFRYTVLDPVAKTREMVDMLAPAARSKELELQVWVTDQNPPGESGPLVRLDEDRYAQIVNNLMHNAVKFTPAGGRITVHMIQHPDRFHLDIADTGRGMTEEELARIWDRFYKADPSRTGTDGGGTGLGLTIAKHLVTGMGGHIRVSSRPGAGTTFTVQFPAAGSEMAG